MCQSRLYLYTLNGGNMKKIIIAIVAVVIVFGGGIGAYFLIANPKSSTSSGSSSSSTPLSSVTACDVLTDTVAKSIIGDDTSKPAGSVGDISTTDIAVTTCSYTTNIHTTSTSIPKSSGVSVLARIAKTEAGAANNKEQFTNKPANVQVVKDIGDAAFYNPDFRQLNVLKGNNWYIVTYYVDTITNSTIDTDKQLAQALKFQ